MSQNCVFPSEYTVFCSYIDTRVSGSPIIQDGKLIGTVTHVLVNDPNNGVWHLH